MKFALPCNLLLIFFHSFQYSSIGHFPFTAPAYFAYDSIVSFHLQDSPFIDIYILNAADFSMTLVVSFFIYEFFGRFKIDFIVTKIRLNAISFLYFLNILHQILQGFKLEFCRNTIS